MLATPYAPLDLPRELGRRLQSRRLDRGWTRNDLGARAQVSPETLKKFERTGQISLPRLVKLAVALGVVHEIDRLFTAALPASLQALEAHARRRGRRRGTAQRIAK